MSITHIQLRPTVPVYNGVQLDTRDATAEEAEDDSCLWSVYVGEPGGFSLLADFADKVDAEFFAHHLCELHNAAFDEVLP